MNIQEFLNTKEKCPICNGALSIAFISGRKQRLRFQDEKLTIIFVMKKLANHQQDYEVGYAFDLKNNTFNIEFYTEWDTYKYIPLHLIVKFQDFNKNLGAGRFTRRCTTCYKYKMDSTSFNLNFKNLNFDFNILDESFELVQTTMNGFKNYYLINNYTTNNSELYYQPSDSPGINIYRSQKLKLPLIQFISEEETAKRLEKIITFS